MLKKKILFVDDVQLFVALEQTFFSSSEYETLVARNGREALDIICAELPDLVFLDLYMPEMDGDECCRVVKEDKQYNHIPIVMVTHGGYPEDIARCREAGCDDIVLKPINRHQLIETARKYLGSHAGNDHL